MKKQNFLRDARIYRRFANVHYGFWRLGRPLGIVLFVLSFMTGVPWWVGVAVFLYALFSKVIFLGYTRETEKAIADGIAAGQIPTDSPEAKHLREMEGLRAAARRAALDQALRGTEGRTGWDDDSR